MAPLAAAVLAGTLAGHESSHEGAGAIAGLTTGVAALILGAVMIRGNFEYHPDVGVEMGGPNLGYNIKWPISSVALYGGVGAVAGMLGAAIGRGTWRH